MNGEFVQLDSELEIYVEQSGHGDLTVLLIPGWTMSTEVFSHQLDYFRSSNDYRCVSYDPRAHGKSSNTQSGHTHQQHGRDLAQLIDTLDLNNIVLCGWSFATLTALSYVNQFGATRIRGMALIDGPPKAVGEDKMTQWFTYDAGDPNGEIEFFTMGRLEDKSATFEKFARWMLEDESPENIDWVTNIANQTPDTAAALLNATSIYCDFEADLKALDGKIPLLYVLRESRGPVVEQWARRYTPTATVAAFGEHLMFWERSNEFNAILQKFLTDIQMKSL